ncbi:restriction endonuclease subunit S [Paenibacillus hunanensis]|uniref:Type I restriction enzyme S subunit n=1 Tax=Paenibacillus hunanensis TaxID=539262 RepID=A0ABU1IWT9_9BACL|nr:restriction endonuclease subunit S [Paenibacillus hunanensis]MDR6242678.1 type I restriction enzyme S subunit [Paenibacillus hunanensis]GGJ01829.1 type I restriction-modification system subunit S [Paenibacillus hunanensis]
MSFDYDKSKNIDFVQWSECTIGEQITLQRGFDITKKKIRVGAYPVISSSGITGFHKEFKVEGPGVIIGRKGTLGTVFYVDKNYWPHDTSLWVKDFKGNDPKFVYYFLKTLDMKQYNVGSANPTLNRNHVHPLKVKWPIFTLQRKISDILGVLDEQIELNNAINKNLEQIAQALFKRWFIDFEFPNENGEPYKSSGGEFEESELGFIPKGWIVSNIYEVAEISMGQSPKSEFYNNIGDGLPFHQGVTNYGIRFPKNNQFSSQLLRVAKKGSVLISVRAPVGRLNIANCDMVIGRGLGAINSKTENNSYLFYSLKTIFAREDQYGSGTIFNSVTKKELENIKIVYPIARVINQYEKVAKFIDKQIFNLSNEIDSLVNLRDTLLPKLMSGELRVPVEKDTEVTIQP